jgi:hypothetical protein
VLVSPAMLTVVLPLRTISGLQSTKARAWVVPTMEHHSRPSRNLASTKLAAGSHRTAAVVMETRAAGVLMEAGKALDMHLRAPSAQAPRLQATLPLPLDTRLHRQASAARASESPLPPLAARPARNTRRRRLRTRLRRQPMARTRHRSPRLHLRTHPPRLRTRPLRLRTLRLLRATARPHRLTWHVVPHRHTTLQRRLPTARRRPCTAPAARSLEAEPTGARQHLPHRPATVPPARCTARRVPPPTHTRQLLRSSLPPLQALRRTLLRRLSGRLLLLPTLRRKFS